MNPSQHDQNIVENVNYFKTSVVHVICGQEISLSFFLFAIVGTFVSSQGQDRRDGVTLWH